QIAVSTALGDDVLLLRSFHGREALSELFEYHLDLLSADAGIDPTQIVGTPVAIRVSSSEGPTRYLNGFVSQFGYAGQNDEGVSYTATVVPWLWFLTQTSDCRIFQNLSCRQIIEKIFTDLGFTDFDLSQLTANYQPREYCVQYRETDFAFVTRLMEEEGIFYFFRHTANKHMLVLADGTSAYSNLPDAKVDYPDPDGIDDRQPRITRWEHKVAFRTGRIAQTDFNFKKPKQSMATRTQTKMKVPGTVKFEKYDYPGDYVERGAGQPLTTVLMEQEEAAHDVAGGESTYRTLTPAGRFTIGRHRNRVEQGKSYVLTSVETAANVGESYTSQVSGGGEAEVSNRFQGIPAATVFRAPRKTPRPIVEGPQTAVVVGHKGEEIDPDEHGRVKVQFHWDREGQKDEKSSCWVRVSQIHAGAGWGSIDLPRIGEEVIVDFLEGNPDRPIITGRVYNGDNKPPFALPGEMTRSGIKSNTHKGKGFNEVSLDDTAGKEQIRVNAQQNMDTVVGNNQTLVVGNDRTSTIKNNDTLTVGVNAVESVGVDKSVKVGSNMNVQVGKNLMVNAGSTLTLKCGASQIFMNAGGVITISGTIITIAAASNASVVAPFTEIVGGVMLMTVGGAANIMQGALTHVGGAALCAVNGAKVDVNGTAETAIKGGLITLN
ncbi:MAG: type VI secretion system tip protein VgrG, partial [Planctomycetota bacterium]|nr:type VI secretion system tip protein VgrG [Planctomycetota bacterium]